MPKSTLAYWCRAVALTKSQAAAIERRGYPRPGVRRDTQRKRRSKIIEIREAAAKQTEILFSEPHFVAGVALYWAEGAKTQSNLAMANTDPALLRVWIRWVQHYLDSDAEFSLRLHLHEGNDESSARAFWRRELDLPDASFNKSHIKAPGTGHRKNHLEHGVCRVRVCRSTDFWHMTMAWIECARERALPDVATLAPGR